jgi:hypothetical protein
MAQELEEGAARDAAEWLSRAASPTFAVLALATLAIGGGTPICSAAREVTPLGGMASMYAVMSAFHLAPWLKLISRRRSAPA